MSAWGLATAKHVGLFVGLLAFLGLACNAPIGGETPSPPPPATSAETNQPTATSTEPATTELAPDSETETPAVLPTFTPIQSTIPADASPTLATVPTETATPEETPTGEADSGPLSFTYVIVWEVTSNPGVAVATVTITANGGGGNYEYYRDDLPVDGPLFQYEWATCRANPGSLRVDSADGQSVRTDYFETPPCPET